MSAGRLYHAVASQGLAVLTCALAASAMQQTNPTTLRCSNSSNSSNSSSNSSNKEHSAAARRKRERSPQEEEEAEEEQRQQPINPCAEYNTLKWRMSYASRKHDCNAEDSCVFIGRSITGACAPRDPSILHKRRSLPNVPLVLPDSDGSTKRRKAALQRQHTAKVIGETIDELESEFEEEGEENFDSKLAANKFVELMSALDVEESTQELALAILKEEGMQAVQVFVKSQLANAAAEELRFQKSATKAFAKDFLIKVMRDPELPGQMGHMLESMFKAPALSTGIRHLIYNAVGMDHTYRSSLTLTIPLIRWLLSETDWMEEEALKLCTYLIRLEQTELATVWLVAWAIREPGILDPAASRGLAASLPFGSEHITAAMVWALTNTLESDWALEMAKSVTVEMIKSSETASGKGTKRPLSSSSSPTVEAISVDTGNDEALGDSDDAPSSSRSSAADSRLGGVVDQKEDVGVNGEVRIVDTKASEGVEGREDAIASAGAEENRRGIGP
ncbi:unnamed protein product [Pylaiella littoralis]